MICSQKQAYTFAYPASTHCLIEEGEIRRVHRSTFAAQAKLSFVYSYFDIDDGKLAYKPAVYVRLVMKMC